MSNQRLASSFLLMFLLSGICCASAGKTGEALAAVALGLACTIYLAVSPSRG